MNRIHTMILGGLLGIAATLGGVSLARADCHLDAQPTDYELAFELAEYRCDAWSAATAEDELLPLGEDGLMSAEEYDRQLGSMYEACMRLSVPPMVLSPAQHYDTTDGAFWRTGGAL